MFDFVNIFLGGAEGSGLIESLGETLGRMFGASHGAGMGDIFSGATRGAVSSEGWFSRLFAFVDEGANVYWDYRLYEDMFRGASQKGWKQADETVKGKVGALREVLESHSFILQQLRTHQGEEGVGELLEAYREKGMDLPQPELLKNAYRKLSQFLHPDKGKVIDDALFKQLNQAKETLEKVLADPAKATAYESAVKGNKAAQKLFEEMSQVDWKNVYEKAAKKARLQLTGPTHEGFTGARKWLAGLTSGQQAALIFATVTGIGIGTYFGAKALEQRRKKHQPEANWQMAVQQDAAPAMPGITP